MASNCLHTEDWEAHLEIVHPVDDVEEGEGEWEEDPGEAVDLRGRVERATRQHCRLLAFLPDQDQLFIFFLPIFFPLTSIDHKFLPPECFIGQETVEKLAKE